MIDYSLVVPVLRGKETLSALIQDASSFFTERSKTFEIILIDDGSRDGSWILIQGMAKDNSNIHGIRLKQTYGQHNATTCGIKHAKGNFIITMDEDLQHPPAEIDKLINKLNEANAHAVCGVAEKRHQSLWRRYVARLTLPIIERFVSCGFKSSSFRLISSESANKIREVERPDIIIDFHTGWPELKVVDVKVKTAATLRGESAYNFPMLVAFAIRVIFGYVLRPRSRWKKGLRNGPQYEIAETC